MVSTDTPTELAKGYKKHGLGATLLSDRVLGVTNHFGLVNTGMHSGPPPPVGAKKLPIPTSLLVDASGSVLWMDQSENYQHGSDPDYLIAALREHID
ncbi:MAG: peroxiredoxin [Halioglobus sp.]|jgi:peroxiredoxin